MTERRRLAVLALCLGLVVAWIGWGDLGGHEQRCLFAVTIGQDKSGFQEVPCDATLEEQMRYLHDHPDDFHPGTPDSN